MKKTLLVTGGTRGIGEAVVRAAAGKYNVAFCFRHSTERALELEREFGESVKGFKCDVSSSKQVDEMIEAVHGCFGRVDGLVNNAGISTVGLLQDMTDEDWHSLMSVNLDGVFYVTRAVLPEMISRKDGKIVNVSSIWGEEGASCEVAYSASKAGVIGFSKALSKELAPSGITVSVICPSAVDTDMMNGYSEDEIADFCRETQTEKMLTAEEVALQILNILAL